MYTVHRYSTVSSSGGGGSRRAKKLSDGSRPTSSHKRRRLTYEHASGSTGSSGESSGLAPRTDRIVAAAARSTRLQVRNAAKHDTPKIKLANGPVDDEVFISPKRKR
jgi:hypothetical protein